MQPIYDTSKVEPHWDDADDKEIPENDFRPRENESLADILKRVGAVELAAKRIVQSLGAQTPQGMPDYRTRLDGAKQVRDTCEGTPDKKPAPVKADKVGAPEPGSLINSKAAKPKTPAIP